MHNSKLFQINVLIKGPVVWKKPICLVKLREVLRLSSSDKCYYFPISQMRKLRHKEDKLSNVLWFYIIIYD